MDPENSIASFLLLTADLLIKLEPDASLLCSFNCALSLEQTLQTYQHSVLLKVKSLLNRFPTSAIPSRLLCYYLHSLFKKKSNFLT